MVTGVSGFRFIARQDAVISSRKIISPTKGNRGIVFGEKAEKPSVALCLS